MRKYELMVIFDEDQIPLDENKNTLSSLFSNNKVEILEEKDMGHRDLSFPINEKKRGHYFLFTMQCEQAVLNALESTFKLNKGIMRYLIVRQN